MDSRTYNIASILRGVDDAGDVFLVMGSVKWGSGGIGV